MTDKKLLQIIKSFRYGLIGRKDSDFMCLYVSAPLQAFLKFNYKMNTRLVDGYCKVGIFEPEHCWLELEDGRIIDPTYDQFFEKGLKPKVYIGEKPDNYFEMVLTPAERGR